MLLAAKVTLRPENGVLVGGLTADDFYEYWWSMRIILIYLDYPNAARPDICNSPGSAASSVTAERSWHFQSG